jgi:Lon protease-like protein
MQWPNAMGVIVLPNVILFPQAFLPLYIFEQRYRRMLADSLASHRLLCVAMQHPARRRESPSAIAGIGVVRVARQHPDSTSHVVLQSLARARLGPATRYRPYRTHGIGVLSSRSGDLSTIDNLTTRLLHLVASRLKDPPGLARGLEEDLPVEPDSPPAPKGMEFLTHVDGPEQIADLVSWTLLSSPKQRQILLETLDVETRLRRLIHFLGSEEAGGPPEPGEDA